MRLAAAIRVANRAAARADGTRVTISRDELETDCVPATRGITNFETVDSSQMLLQVRSQDFKIEAADYDFGNGPVEPQIGDMVHVTDTDGSTRLFELLDLPGQPSWRWSDSYKQFVRLHTKEVPSS